MTGQNIRQIQAISDAVQETLGAKGVKPATSKAVTVPGGFFSTISTSSSTSSALSHGRSTPSTGYGDQLIASL